MSEKFATFTLALLILASVPSLLPKTNLHPSKEISQTNKSDHLSLGPQSPWPACGSDDVAKNSNFILLAEAKGVAGLGKAGGDGSAGSDKAGQQVPPEVYNALTYAGSAFLFTLSVPLILYGLNKLLNRIEDCFGCGPSNRKKRRKEKELSATKKKAPSDPPDQKQHQQLQNQKLFQEMHQQLLTFNKLQAQSLLTSVSNTTNDQPTPNTNIQQQQQQPQPVPALSADSIAITLQYDSEPNYKTSTLMQSNFQQPFIVSSVPN